MLVLNDVVLENIMHKSKGIFTNEWISKFIAIGSRGTLGL
jgi:hypothetical protein